MRHPSLSILAAAFLCLVSASTFAECPAQESRAAGFSKSISEFFDRKQALAPGLQLMSVRKNPACARQSSQTP
jgi:hypothetical protein